MLAITGGLCFVLGGYPSAAMHKFRENCWGVGLNAPPVIDVKLDPSNYPLSADKKKITIAPVPAKMRNGDDLPADTLTVVIFYNGAKEKMNLISESGPIDVPDDTSGVVIYLHSREQGTVSVPVRYALK
jgi:hypothetical protein